MANDEPRNFDRPDDNLGLSTTSSEDLFDDREADFLELEGEDEERRHWEASLASELTWTSVIS